ncbi:uncharacterized protein [Miscanthus floridulus]
MVSLKGWRKYVYLLSVHCAYDSESHSCVYKVHSVAFQELTPGNVSLGKLFCLPPCILLESGTNWRWRKMERRTMAKEEEKEGRAVAKDTRKRRSESNRKPDGSSNREDAKPKKKKVEYVVSLGHNSKMSDRHKGQLACLAALVTAKKTDLRATDNMQEILESDANNAGVYMEWSEEEETYFIHARSQSRQLLKFELLVIAGFGAVPEETEIKNPLLVFSEGFGNGGKWEDTKMLLFEVFSKPDANINCAKDYLYAFTRTSGKIYLRI